MAESRTFLKSLPDRTRGLAAGLAVTTAVSALTLDKANAEADTPYHTNATTTAPVATPQATSFAPIPVTAETLPPPYVPLHPTQTEVDTLRMLEKNALAIAAHEAAVAHRTQTDNSSLYQEAQSLQRRLADQKIQDAALIAAANQRADQATGQLAEESGQNAQLEAELQDARAKLADAIAAKAIEATPSAAKPATPTKPTSGAAAAPAPAPGAGTGATAATPPHNGGSGSSVTPLPAAHAPGKTASGNGAGWVNQIFGGTNSSTRMLGLGLLELLSLWGRGRSKGTRAVARAAQAAAGLAPPPVAPPGAGLRAGAPLGSASGARPGSSGPAVNNPFAGYFHGGVSNATTGSVAGPAAGQTPSVSPALKAVEWLETKSYQVSHTSAGSQVVSNAAGQEVATIHGDQIGVHANVANDSQIKDLEAMKHLIQAAVLMHPDGFFANGFSDAVKAQINQITQDMLNKGELVDRAGHQLSAVKMDGVELNAVVAASAPHQPVPAAPPTTIAFVSQLVPVVYSTETPLLATPPQTTGGLNSHNVALVEQIVNGLDKDKYVAVQGDGKSIVIKAANNPNGPDLLLLRQGNDGSLYADIDRDLGRKIGGEALDAVVALRKSITTQIAVAAVTPPDSAVVTKTSAATQSALSTKWEKGKVRSYAILREKAVAATDARPIVKVNQTNNPPPFGLQ